MTMARTYDALAYMSALSRREPPEEPSAPHSQDHYHEKRGDEQDVCREVDVCMRPVQTGGRKHGSDVHDDTTVPGIDSSEIHSEAQKAKSDSNE